MNPIDALLDEIHAAMRAAGLSQAELARRMGSAEPVVSDVFRNAGNPTVGYLRRMWAVIEKAAKT